MKRKLLIILGVVLLVGLTIRSVRNYITNFKREHVWYISQLNAEFSAVIDTVRRPHIFFHITHGKFDYSRESRVNRELKYNGVTQLFRYLPDNGLVLMVDNSLQYQKGDSIYLNTSIDRIRIFRDHKLLSDKSLIGSIRAKPYKDLF